MTAIRQPSPYSPLPPAPTALAPSASASASAPAAPASSSAGVSNEGYGNRPVAGRTNGQQVETESVDLSFGDFLDMINPLQHLPIVSTIYRKLTGDEQSATANVMGGLLYGGPIGLIAAVVSQQVKDTTGDEPLGHAYAMLDGKDQGTGQDKAAASKLAQATPVANNSGAFQLASASNMPTTLAPVAAPAPAASAVSSPAGAKAGSALPETAKLAQVVGQQTGQDRAQDKSQAHGKNLQPTALDPAKSPAKLPGHSADMAQAPVVSPQDMRNKMMEGLDRYQALVKARQAADAAAGMANQSPNDARNDDKKDRAAGVVGMIPASATAPLKKSAPIGGYGYDGLLLDQSL